MAKKRPKLRMTNADYVAIAISPALIMALVGSLVFFLIEVLYVGQYQARLIYVFSLFVFATVLIGRIAIEMGTERAVLFALPLGIAMFLVLAKFVPHSSPYSHLINIGLLGIVWWSAHKLTWDCTLIDDSEDASGVGLIQQLGVDELVAENELLPNENSDKIKTPHTPGLWVLYFSLAALPLFGIGQKWIPAGDVGRRQYAFGLLAVYVASGLALLVTTSFLGLRRYLRQRRIEMPTPMAATWVVTGGALIAVVMLLAALIPRPQAEFAISQVPWQVHAPSDLAASRTSVGKEGTDDDREEASKVINDETDPNATATREGDNPTTSSKEGEKQSNSGESSEENSETGEPEAPTESQPSSEQAEPGKRIERIERVEQASDDGETAETSAESSVESSQEDEQQKDEGKSETTSGPLRSRPALPNLMPAIGGVTGVLKLVLYAAIALALVFLAWRNRKALAKAIAEIAALIREFLGRLFGGGRVKPTSDADNETVKNGGPPPRAFASFADPFAGGQARSMPPDEVVHYTFEAFEAWAREQGHPRSPDQTPSELIRQAIPEQSPLWAESQQLARLYNEAAYAPGAISTSAVAGLAPFWRLLRRSSETRLESVS